MVSTLLELLGVALVIAGASLVFVPAGLIVAGLVCVLVGYIRGAAA